MVHGVSPGVEMADASLQADCVPSDFVDHATPWRRAGAVCMRAKRVRVRARAAASVAPLACMAMHVCVQTDDWLRTDSITSVLTRKARLPD